MTIPDRLDALHDGEQELRARSCAIIAKDPKLFLHMEVTQAVMDLLDQFRQYPTEDEDLKVVQALGLRAFNALASSIKLTLSGYYQNGSLLLRDVLETSFLLDYFSTHPCVIQDWRVADRGTIGRRFKPIDIRKALDERDGFTGLKRANQYQLLSDLAGHPSMLSFRMLCPQGMDAQLGPFVDSSVISAVFEEMGKLAVHLGEIIDRFLPAEWAPAMSARLEFARLKLDWIEAFYSS